MTDATGNGVLALRACVVLSAALGALTPGALRAQETLHEQWRVETPGDLPQAIAVDPAVPGLFYVALKTGGVAVYDETGRAPRRIGTVERRALGNLDAMHLVLRGGRLYVALGDFFAARSRAGLAVLDLGDPRAPRVVDVWLTPDEVKGAAAVASDGRHAYLATMHHGVMTFDVGAASIRHVTTVVPDPGFPRKNPTAVQRPNARGLALAGDLLFVAYDAGGLRVLDVAAPDAPREIGRYVNAGMRNKQQAYNDVVVDGTRAYVSVDYAGLEILDLADPEHPRQLGWWNPWHAERFSNLWLNSPGHANQIGLDPGAGLVYLSAGDSELQVVDVRNPATPTLRARVGTAKDGRGTWGMMLGADRVYLSYIRALVPFRGTWAGIVAVDRAP
ncbi:MAG: hypothetical protein R2745_00840 [Vicinamibacterales bacterium]